MRALCTLICKHNPCKGTRHISGGVCCGSAAKSLRVTMRKHTPACTRPARPRRCCAAAWETIVVRRRVMPRVESNASSLTRHQSMTTVQSSMVIEVSATLVATTTLRRPFGGGSNTRACCAGGRPPCRGRGSTSLFRPGASAQGRVACCC